jgi:hypothetical protein
MKTQGALSAAVTPLRPTGVANTRTPVAVSPDPRPKTRLGVVETLLTKNEEFG